MKQKTKIHSNYPKVSIIIVNAKGIKFLDRCIRSVLKTKYQNFEIIVVDCLTNDLYKIRKKYPSVKFIHFNKDIGASESHNVGVKYVDKNSKYIAFLDNDTEVTPNWLKELVDLLEKNPNIGAAQSKLLFLNKKSKINSVGIFINYYGGIEPRGHNENDKGQYDFQYNISGASGASMIVRKKLYESIRGFDPYFFIYCDDIDFGWRVWLSGHKVIFAPKSVVYHGKSATTRMSSFSIFHHVKNKYLVFLKNYNFDNFLLVLLMHFISDIFLFLYEVLMRNIKAASARIKGLFWIILNTKLILKKRFEVQNLVNKVSGDFIKSNMMIRPSPYLKRFSKFTAVRKYK